MEGLDSYTFTDVHYNVLNAIIANVSVNLGDHCSVVDEPGLASWLTDGPPQFVDRTSLKDTQEVIGTNVRVQYLDWLDYSQEDIERLDYQVVFGSDLTYSTDLLPPLAKLLHKLLSKKSGGSKKKEAYISCTHRNGDSIRLFLDKLTETGLQYEVAFKATFGPSDGLVINHEPLRTVSVFHISLLDQ